MHNWQLFNTKGFQVEVVHQVDAESQVMEIALY
jgi:hypothetical protein